MYKTCTDIENSLYIAPNEIRSCCQRFFYKGKMRGDAKLIEIKDGITPTIDQIVNARKKILKQIQNEENEDCKGCPLIQKVKKEPEITSKVSHLSIEHHSVCNLRCNYCSEIYYGGKKSKYDVVKFISYLSRSNSLNDCDQVVWGGGEPTLDKSFGQILEEIHKYANPKIYHRVFTNAVKFSEPVYEFLKKNLIKITTSIDSGTQEKFKEIRGRPRFIEVFENLKKYSEIDPSKITIKYILTEDNKQKCELDSFVDSCLKYKLIMCNYQIIVNYKKSQFDINFLKAMIYLFAKLYNAKMTKIFLDDHIVKRFCSLKNEELQEINKYIKDNNLINIILNPNQIENLVIFGAGVIAKEIIKKTSFVKNLKDFDLVDSNSKKIGKIFYKKKIKSPRILKDDKRKIFIASAEAFDEIYNCIKEIKGSTNSILVGIAI
jgi:wyosine [tRNA(Phe)-imidazoG37] synthetase (radical SAM superfamily)